MKILLCLSALLALAPAQDKKKPPAPDDLPRRVEEAIRKGIEYLKKDKIQQRSLELVLLTFSHAGVPESDPAFKEAFDRMMEEKPERTYRVSLRAMLLEKLDRVKHQKEIYHCAQFLVDNQRDNGQWGYGTPTTLGELPKGVPSKDRSKVATSGGKGKAPEEKIPLLRIPVKKNPEHKDPERGDNSNSQYAALGLRACHDAGMIIPEETIQKAIKWWRDSQVSVVENEKGAENKPAPVATGNPLHAVKPLGWGYGQEDEKPSTHSSGSMTVGAVGALSICHYILGKPWKADLDILEGLRWCGDNFTVTENAGRGQGYHYYYLYGMERMGILYGTDHLGTHDWYREGAEFLVKDQNADGSWGGAKEKGRTGPEVDTCFAILFLRRATKPLIDVASVDGAPRGK